MIMAWRDREGRLNFMFLGDGRLSTRKRDISGDGGKHHEKLRLREFRVLVN